jgi:beta-lactamase class D
MRSVREILVQPAGVIVNAAGEHPFASPWPAGTIVSAKTGAGSTGDGHIVRWLVGHVQRGSRSWTFVSNVVGGADTPANAAIDQAAQALVEEHVLR